MPEPDWKSQKHGPGKVAAYYDALTASYLDLYGGIIQAYRPADDTELLAHIAGSANLAAGQLVLDAGCGVGAPAIFFAEAIPGIRIEAVNISRVQVAEGRERIAGAGFAEQIRIREGDFHQLEALFPEGSFDRILFLESLGHALDVKQVIRSAHAVMKDSGYLYLKDFFVRESDDPEMQARMNKVMDNINQHYAYNVLDLHETISALRRGGFHLDLIRRMPFQPDVRIRTEFEDHFGIDLYDGGPEFMAAEWLEIRCQKLAW